MIIWKQTRNAQQLAPENEKQYWKLNNCWLDKKTELLVWAKQQSGPTRNSKVPTTDHCTCLKTLVYWQNDRVHEPILVKKHKESCEQRPLCLSHLSKTQPRKTCLHCSKLLMGHSRPGRGILFSCSHLRDINMS